MSENPTREGQLESASSSPETEARREFLKSLGKFAVVTPPAVTFLLSTSMSSSAVAASGAGASRFAPGQLAKVTGEPAKTFAPGQQAKVTGEPAKTFAPGQQKKNK